MYVYVSVGVHMCVCVPDREESRVFANRGVDSGSNVIVWMMVYLTGYSDYLTGFCEPLSPPYRGHTYKYLKNV